MIEKDMHRLADIIVNKIRALQDELDAQFYEEVEKLNAGWEKIEIDPAMIAALESAQKELLEKLEENLIKAVKDEDFILAGKLRDKINKCKGK